MGQELGIRDWGLEFAGSSQSALPDSELRRTGDRGQHPNPSPVSRCPSRMVGLFCVHPSRQWPVVPPQSASIGACESIKRNVNRPHSVVAKPQAAYHRLWPVRAFADRFTNSNPSSPKPLIPSSLYPLIPMSADAKSPERVRRMFGEIARRVRSAEPPAVAGHRLGLAAADGAAGAAGRRCARRSWTCARARRDLALAYGRARPAGADRGHRLLPAHAGPGPRKVPPAGRRPHRPGRGRRPATALSGRHVPDRLRGLRAAEPERHGRGVWAKWRGSAGPAAAWPSWSSPRPGPAAGGGLCLVLPPRAAADRPDAGTQSLRRLTIIFRPASAGSPRPRRWPSGCGPPDWPRSASSGSPAESLRCTWAETALTP